MEEKNQKSLFLTAETKMIAIIAGVAMIALSAINIFLIVFYSPSETTTIEALLSIVPFSFSLFLLLVSFIVYGVLQIKVFVDYKKQHKSLCTNGIMYICISALSMIFFGFVIATIASGSAGSVFVYTVLYVSFAIWNIVYAIICFKKEHKNAIFYVIYAVLDVALSVLLTLSLSFVINGNIAFVPLLVALSIIFVALVVCMGVDLVVNYVVKAPEYLETEDGLKILEEQKAKKQLAQEKLQARLDAYRGVEYAQPTQKAQAGEGIEEKLQKLETLYSKSLITEEEYKVKKQKLIDEL